MCTLYNIHCTLYSVLCIVYSVQCTRYLFAITSPFNGAPEITINHCIQVSSFVIYIYMCVCVCVCVFIYINFVRKSPCLILIPSILLIHYVIIDVLTLSLRRLCHSRGLCITAVLNTYTIYIYIMYVLHLMTYSIKRTKYSI